MNTADRLDALLKNPSLTLPCPEKAVFFSDLHMGDGGPADDFRPNHELFCKTLIRYRDDGFHIFLLGDVLELWQFSKEAISWYTYLDDFFKQCRWIKGNHDQELDLPEAILLTGAARPILLVHGHQGDWWNDNRWGFTKWFVKYVWKTLEYAGVKDEWLSASKNLKRHDRVRRALIEWANSRKVILTHGHIHTNEHNGFEWDCGSQTISGRIECVEMVKGGLTLKTWR